MPTDAEEAAINRGIALDPDNPELEDAFFASARPAADVLPKNVYASLARRRGPGKKPAKVQVTLRIDAGLLSNLRDLGEGWQVRAGAALANMVEQERKGRR